MAKRKIRKMKGKKLTLKSNKVLTNYRYYSILDENKKHIGCVFYSHDGEVSVVGGDVINENYKMRHCADDVAFYDRMKERGDEFAGARTKHLSSMTEPIAKALMVMLTDPKIRLFLDTNDPKAVEASVRALNEAKVSVS